MKYLSIFSTNSDYTTGKSDATFGRPHVSYIKADHSIIYDQLEAEAEGA